MRTDDVGSDELIRRGDRAIHMRLCGKVYDQVDFLLVEKLIEEHAIANVSLDESHLRVAVSRRKARQVACIGQCIEYDDSIGWVFPQPIVNKVRADESGAAGDEDRSVHCCVLASCNTSRSASRQCG